MIILCLPGSTKPAKTKTSSALSSFLYLTSLGFRGSPLANLRDRTVSGMLQIKMSFSGYGKFSLNLLNQSWSLSTLSLLPKVFFMPWEMDKQARMARSPWLPRCFLTFFSSRKRLNMEMSVREMTVFLVRLPSKRG